MSGRRAKYSLLLITGVILFHALVTKVADTASSFVDYAIPALQHLKQSDASPLSASQSSFKPINRPNPMKIGRMPKHQQAPWVITQALIKVTDDTSDPDILHFQLPSGRNIRAIRNQKQSRDQQSFLPPGYTVFSGNLDASDSDASGQIQMVTGENGSISGRLLFDDGRVFELFSNDAGETFIQELDSSKYPTEKEAQVQTIEQTTALTEQAPTEQASPEEHRNAVTADLTAATHTAFAPSNSLGHDSLPGRIDAMVVYSTNTMNAAGGRAAMETLIANSIASTNSAYQNSQVTGRIRLLKSLEVSYQDSGNVDTDLTRISTPNDGFMDNVESERITAGADIVVLISTSANYCGVSYGLYSLSPSYKYTSFSVVSRGCAVGNLTFAHEVGHLLGADHDRANGSGELRSYGFGYNQGTWRTVMSYGSSTRIPYFSNPNVLYNGLPTGFAEGLPNSADNARVLNESMPFVATYYAAPIIPYSISGTIMNGLTPLSGVTISGGALGNAVTDATGRYSFNEIPSETEYSIVPAIAGYSFTPASASGTLIANTTHDFTASVLKYSISGSITSGGSPLRGVTISGGALGDTTTDSNGNYSFNNITHGTTYTITPALPGYTFSPTSATGLLAANVTHNFAATILSYSITGTVTSAGAPLAGVTVSGGPLGSVLTNSSGYYSFSNVTYGTTYTIAPTLVGYAFSPTNASGTLTNNIIHSFAATVLKYTISGTITNAGAPLSGVTVSAGTLGSLATNASGNFTFNSVPHGTSYTITPSLAGFTFSPISASGTLTSNTTYTFAATAIKYTISGTVTASGAPLSGVSISGGALGNAITDSAGNYTFGNIAHGKTYSIAPSLAGFTFSPTSASGTLTSNTTHSFNATALKYTISGTLTNAGEPLSGVTISAGALGSVITNAAGSYTFSNIAYNTTYTVTPSFPGHSFSPAQTTNTITTNSTHNFAATILKYTISGSVSNAGTPLAGVTISAGTLGSVVTNTSGNYQFSNIPYATNYTVTASLAGSEFAPVSVSGTLTGNATHSFAATIKKYTISGTVTDAGSPLVGVTLSSGILGNAVSDSRGYYSFSNVTHGTTYTITPSLAGYAFAPKSTSNTITGDTIHNFATTALLYSITGTVTHADLPLGNVTVSGGTLGSTMTDASGRYALSSIAPNSVYQLNLSKDGYNFSPASAAGTVTSDLVINFRAAKATRRVFGNVTLKTGPAAGITINTNLGRSIRTTSDGSYSFEGVWVLDQLNITPTGLGYGFSPASRTVPAGTSDATGINFSATCQNSFVEVSGVCELRSTPPPKPTNVTASDGTSSNHVMVSWSINTPNSSATPTSVQVLRSTVGDIANATVIGSASATSSYQDNTAKGDTLYEYAVRSLNKAGTSSLSASDIGYLGPNHDWDNDGLRNDREYSIGTNPHAFDTDLDSISDGQELIDETNPLDHGSFKEVRDRIVCAEWNGFFTPMPNIMEHLNVGNSTLAVVSTLYSVSGSTLSKSKFALLPNQQQDLGVHDMQGWGADQVGRICSSNSGPAGSLDGNMIYYKSSNSQAALNPEDIQFAFAMPFANGFAGTQYLSFNTYNPSFSPQDSHNLVANWILISSFSGQTERGTLSAYDISGQLLRSTRLSVPPKGRYDYPAHQFGPNKVGLLEWKPDNNKVRFTTRNIRYVYDNLGELNSFDSAFQLEGVVGSGEQLTAFLDTREGSAIVELSNVLTTRLTVSLELHDSTGQLKDSAVFNLPPKSSRHYIADPKLLHSLGMATVKGSQPEGLMAVVMHYGREASGKLKYIYGNIAKEPLGTVLHGSYNTYLHQGCRAIVVNPQIRASTVQIRLQRSDGTAIKLTASNNANGEFTVPAKGAIDVNICDSETTTAYGTVSLQIDTPNTIWATMLRVSGFGKYRFPTPLRE